MGVQRQICTALLRRLNELETGFEKASFPVRGVSHCLFRKKATPNLFFFVMVVMSKGAPGFTLELAWSDKESFPLDAPFGSPLKADDRPDPDRIALPSLRFRIAALLGSNRDRFWQVGGR